MNNDTLGSVFRDLVINKGNHPHVHDQEIASLEKTWPSMYRLVRLVQKQDTVNPFPKDMPWQIREEIQDRDN